MGHESRHLRSLLRELREAFTTEIGDLAATGYADLATEIGAALDEFENVYLSLEDYKAGRKVTIEAVVDAARRWANLPPVAETANKELDGLEDD